MQGEAVDVGMVRRYVVGSLFYAAVYYAVDRFLWPSLRSPVAAIPPAVLWGLIMQALFTRGERLRREGKERYPPVFYLGGGVVGLGLCTGCWFSSTPRPAGLAAFGLLSGVAFSLWLLACGYLVGRRRAG